MTDDDRPDTIPSGLASSAARTLLSTLGGDEKAKEFNQALEQMGLSESDLDGALASGLALGTTVAEQRRAMRSDAFSDDPDTHAHAHADENEPAIHIRELQEDGEFAGLRVLCSDPAATITANDDLELLFVQHSAGREDYPLTFAAGEQIELERESMAEAIIRPVGYDPDPGIDEDEDDDETGDEI